MKKIIILFIILGSCTLSLKGQDSVSLSKGNTDMIYPIIYEKAYELEKKCYSLNKITYDTGAVIFDLIDTTNNNLPKVEIINNIVKLIDASPRVNFLNNHVFHIYGINDECVSILMLIHDDKAYFFDEYEMWSQPVNLEDSTQWEFDSMYFKHPPPIHPTTPNYAYVFRHPKKLDALLDFINRKGIYYTDEELLRIKHFNSNRWRIRTYK